MIFFYGYFREQERHEEKDNIITRNLRIFKEITRNLRIFEDIRSSTTGQKGRAMGFRTSGLGGGRCLNGTFP